MKTSKQYKRAAIWWFCSPLISLAAILVAWIVLSVVMVRGAGMSPSAQTAAQVINVALGFLAIVILVIMIPLGAILGARSIGLARRTREVEQGGAVDPRSGKGDDSIIPPEIKGWSWAGFSLNWIWGVYNGIWSSLWCWAPFVGIVFPFYLGFQGRELAWRKAEWASVEAFLASQKKWDALGLGLFILSIVLLAIQVTIVIGAMVIDK